ncbi:transposase (plasmid) [Halobiforma lacisalsi AJ5]|uniref:Transposase n=1 Tax=Natronobacterium lacisalsi AJ5 TaxID=358396 RepID=M0LV06_NATLA|nr:transposase [Halobiforma lacisalsi AJ5]EMA37402.1 hypothetical protein C445_00896 [Halobiforma lacisalsi AJ5]
MVQRSTLDFITLIIFWLFFSWMTVITVFLLSPINVQNYLVEMYIGMLLVGPVWYVFYNKMGENT